MTTVAPYVIAFNGPPRSGKDTVGHALIDIIARESDMPIFHYELKSFMMETAMSLFGVDTREQYEQRKDVVDPYFGTSIRLWMIAFSEQFMKPNYGHEVWTRIVNQRHMAKRIQVPHVVVVTDLGFPIEVEALAHEMTEPSRFALVQLERAGKDFTGDSRTYVTIDHHRSYQARFCNDGPVSETAEAVHEWLTKHLGWPV